MTAVQGVSSDGTLEQMHYYADHRLGDVAGLMDDSGNMSEWMRRSAYGVPFEFPGEDENSSAVIQGRTDTSAYGIRGDLDIDANKSDKSNAKFVAMGLATELAAQDPRGHMYVGSFGMTMASAIIQEGEGIHWSMYDPVMIRERERKRIAERKSALIQIVVDEFLSDSWASCVASTCPCPCKESDASSGDPNCKWARDTEYAEKAYHNGNHCYRSRGIKCQDEDGDDITSANQCCYDSSGNLVTSLKAGGGTMDKASTRDEDGDFDFVGALNHWVTDVEPFDALAALEMEALYELMRPVDNSNGCAENPPSKK